MVFNGRSREVDMEGGSVYPVPTKIVTGMQGTEPAGADSAKAVHAVRFLTPDPLDHCARAFDVVRRMGFRFVGVHTRAASRACFMVRLDFIPNGALSPDLLADRISCFVGVTEVEMGPRQAATSSSQK
jgi:acetolactate synthase regulatory subunit